MVTPVVPVLDHAAVLAAVSPARAIAEVREAFVVRLPAMTPRETMTGLRPEHRAATGRSG